MGFDKKYLSLVYVEDLVDGILLSAQNDVANGETYFVCMDNPYNWDEIGDVTSKILGKKAIKISLPLSDILQKSLHLFPAKLQR